MSSTQIIQDLLKKNGHFRMVTIDNTGARSFASKGDLDSSAAKAEEAYRQLLRGSGAGSEWLGWRRILNPADEDEMARLEQKAAQIRNQADVFIVCGIGGSFMGAKAVIEALEGTPLRTQPEILFAGQHMGAAFLKRLMDDLETPGENGAEKRVFMNVISKSGSTLETALSFRLLRRWFERRYGERASERIIVTTAPSGGALNGLAEKKGYEKFVIPEDTGGRFSVLTPVGLLPAAVAGVDIRALMAGAAAAFRKYEKPDPDLLEYVALRHWFHQNGRSLDVIGSFEPDLQSMAQWLQQLLGESEGKEGKGLFPVPAAFSTDLHSIGQMIQQGRRNLIETLLGVHQPGSDLEIPDTGDDLDGLGYLSGKKLHTINREAMRGTMEAHISGGVPVFQVFLEKLDAENLGELIYLYELFTAIYVYTLGLNPFDQPGVEAYKKAVVRNLRGI